MGARLTTVLAARNLSTPPSRQCRIGRSLVRFLSPYREFLLQLRRKSWHLLWAGWGEAGDGRCGEAVRAQMRAARRSGSTMAGNHNARASSETRAPVTNTRHPPCAQTGEGSALPGAGPFGRVEPEAMWVGRRGRFVTLHARFCLLLRLPCGRWATYCANRSQVARGFVAIASIARAP